MDKSNQQPKWKPRKDFTYMDFTIIVRVEDISILPVKNYSASETLTVYNNRTSHRNIHLDSTNNISIQIMNHTA